MSKAISLFSSVRSFVTRSAITKKKLVVLGTGWGGYRLLKSIDTKVYDVLVISPRNHFLFTPLLASTTVGTLEFRSIVDPIRKTRPNVQYIQAECSGIDPDRKILSCASTLHAGQKPFEVGYDALVVAVGARNNTFNVPGVLEHAYFLKELSHARRIRNKIIENFEMASVPDTSDAERRRLLSFVIVGGGPTGVEFAAELNDFFWEDLCKAFPRVPVNEVKITLLEAGKGILTAFDKRLSNQTMKWFRKGGIDLRMQSLVREVRPGEVVLQDGSVLPAGLVVWSTGIAPRKFLKDVPLPKDALGRLQVDRYLHVAENIWAVGDCAAVEGMQLPATAQVAQQQGKYLADQLNKIGRVGRVNDKGEGFEFNSLGMMAYVGRYKSVLDSPAFKTSGLMAWLSWRSAYLTRLGSLKAKMQVPFDWLRVFIFGRDITNF